MSTTRLDTGRIILCQGFGLRSGRPLRRTGIVVEQGAAKAHGCLAIVVGNVADDFSEVA
jgi:hypothetical protein